MTQDALNASSFGTCDRMKADQKKNRGTVSVEGFIATVLEIQKKWHEDDFKYKNPDTAAGDIEEPEMWFRGQEKANWRLRPQLYRLKKPDEEEIRSDFKRCGRQLISEERQPATEWEWYFLMRHYGAPTRLLDWTDGALIALYFAVRSPDSRMTDAAVWVLDPWWLNSKTVETTGVLLSDWDEAKPYLPKLFEEKLHVRLPAAIDPPHVSRRLAVQRSRFTIHGNQHDGLSAVNREARSRLEKVLIDGSAKARIKKDLARCGILESTVFPDLEGLARELTWTWSK